MVLFLILVLTSSCIWLTGVSAASVVNQPSAQPTFVCNLMDGRAAAVGIRGADLGVSIVDGSILWLVFGDTTGPPGGPPGNQPVVGSSSVIESKLPFDCSSYTWLTSGGKFYQPLLSARKAGNDESTVPAGGITVNHEIYIYSMRVNHWGVSDTDPTHARGVLFKQIQGLFTEVVSWRTDQLFVNAAPLEGELSNGARAIFIVTSAHYRHSPIYLSYVLPENIGKPASYHYLTGYDRNGSPVWASDMTEAKPIPGLENVWAGELSFLYDVPLRTYLLMFVDYNEKVPALDLYSSRTPYGPFYGPEKLYPCGYGPADRPKWLERAWGGCYGGYMLPDSFGPDGHDLYFTFSLWNPYTTVLMRTQISSLSTEATSKASISTQSQATNLPSTTTVVALTSSLGTSLLIITAAIMLIVTAIAFSIIKRKKTATRLRTVVTHRSQEQSQKRPTNLNHLE